MRPLVTRRRVSGPFAVLACCAERLTAATRSLVVMVCRNAYHKNIKHACISSSAPSRDCGRSELEVEKAKRSEPFTTVAYLLLTDCSRPHSPSPSSPSHAPARAPPMTGSHAAHQIRKSRALGGVSAHVCGRCCSARRSAAAQGVAAAAPPAAAHSAVAHSAAAGAAAACFGGARRAPARWRTAAPGGGGGGDGVERAE